LLQLQQQRDSRCHERARELLPAERRNGQQKDDAGDQAYFPANAFAEHQQASDDFERRHQPAPDCRLWRNE